MTLTGMARKLAKLMAQQSALNDGRYVWHESDFTEFDRECIDTYAQELTNLFYHADGRKWWDVVDTITRLAPADFHIGFEAQDKIIEVCTAYGIQFA